MPHRWRWTELRPQLLAAGRLVPMEQAERRVLVLCNPGLPGALVRHRHAVRAGSRSSMPGESAPSHHHTPAALAWSSRDSGAFTTVEGVRCEMEPGDLIITPPMRWHDHGHEVSEPVIWLDGLDIPLVRAFEGLVGVQDAPGADCRDGHRLLARTSSPRPGWCRAALALSGNGLSTGALALARGARGARRACRPAPPREQAVTLRYVNPRTGAPPLATMGCEAQWLRPGEATRAERRTGSGVFHVIEGAARLASATRSSRWEPGDCFAVPPWQWIEHRNGSERLAGRALPPPNDEPALRSLGLRQGRDPGPDARGAAQSAALSPPGDRQRRRPAAPARRRPTTRAHHS